MANDSRRNLFSPVTFVIVGAVILLVAAFGIWWFLIGGLARYRIQSAVQQIASGHNAHAARRELLEANDRGAVLAELKSALEAEDDDVNGKQEIINTLFQFKERAPVERALRSDVPSARYAAALVLQRYPQHAEQCRQIAIEWLQDTDSPYRARAVELADGLQLEETVPQLLSILDEGAQGKTIPLPLMRAVLAALGNFEPPGTAPKVLAIARDENQDPNARTIALKSLGRMKEADAPAVATLLIQIMSDPTQDEVLRMTAASELRVPKYRSDEATASFERILLDPSEKNMPLQRICLHRLGAVAPIEHLRELMKDPRVYNHKYFGIRSDAGTMIQTLHMRDRVSFDILCNHLLVDEDPKTKDTAFIVRLEAWESLWLMTGRISMVEEADLFKNRPPYTDTVDRDSLVWYQWRRHGITKPMVEAMSKVTNNLTKMRSVRDHYSDRWQEIKARWEKEEAQLQERRDKQKEKEEELKKKLEGRKKEQEAFAVARDENQDPDARAIALRSLGKMEDADAPAVARLLIQIMSDTTQDKVLRMTAAAELRAPRYRSDKATAAFERILLDPSEKNLQLQRQCLHRLGAIAPIEHLRKLMKDPRVYGHKYFGIRSDVGTAMQRLHMRDKASFDILCNQLAVDEDPKDTDFVVRLEAWLSLWLMTGRISMVEEPDLFKNRPPLTDVVDRDSLFWYQWGRKGITKTMVEAMRRVTGDLAKMKSVRDSYSSEWPEIKALWEKVEAQAKDDDGE